MKKGLVFLLGFMVLAAGNETQVYAAGMEESFGDLPMVGRISTLDDIPAWALGHVKLLIQQPVIKNPPFATPTLALPLPMVDCAILAYLFNNTKCLLEKYYWNVNQCCFATEGKLETGIEIVFESEKHIAALKDDLPSIHMALTTVIMELRRGWLEADANQCLDPFDDNRALGSRGYRFFVKDGCLETGESKLIEKLAWLFGFKGAVVVGECWPLVSPVAKHRKMPDFFSYTNTKNPYIFIKREMFDEWQRVFSFDIIHPSEEASARDGESTDADFTDTDSVVSAASSAK